MPIKFVSRNSVKRFWTLCANQWLTVCCSDHVACWRFMNKNSSFTCYCKERKGWRPAGTSCPRDCWSALSELSPSNCRPAWRPTELALSTCWDEQRKLGRVYLFYCVLLSKLLWNKIEFGCGVVRKKTTDRVLTDFSALLTFGDFVSLSFLTLIPKANSVPMLYNIHAPIWRDFIDDLMLFLMVFAISQ